jgi:hypothetical protein
MKLVAIALITLASLLGQETGAGGRRPSPFGASTSGAAASPAPAQAGTAGQDRAAPALQSATVQDPYMEELNTALKSQRDAESLDMSLDDRLESVGVCTQEPKNLVDAAAAARAKMLSDFATYYKAHSRRCQQINDDSVQVAADRWADRSEIVAMIGGLRREKSDLERRQRDLSVSLANQNTEESRKVAADLAAMIARKTGQLARSEDTLKLFDQAQDYLKQRREFARIRLRELNELVEDVRAESTLWEHLYRGKLYSWQLRCDKATPPVEAFHTNYRPVVDKQ